MGHPLIGQLLRGMGMLTSIDIDEILSEQGMTKRRFGEIAISWGLCEPEHVCSAWCSQLSDGRPCIDLGVAPPEAHAVGCLPGEVARRLRVVPVRIIGNDLVVAATRMPDAAAAAEISRRAGREVRFVIADADQITRAIAQLYPIAQAAA